MAMNEAKEVFGKMLRWTAEPKNADQAAKTIYMGDAVQGYYVTKREGVGANDSTVYELLLSTGEKVSFWGSDLIDGKFAEIPLNCEVRVEFLGIAQPKTPKGRAYANFRVMFDVDSKRPADLKEVGPVNADIESSAAAAMAPAPQPQAAAPSAPVATAPTAPAAPAPTAPAPAAPTSAGEGF